MKIRSWNIRGWDLGKRGGWLRIFATSESGCSDVSGNKKRSV